MFVSGLGEGIVSGLRGVGVGVEFWTMGDGVWITLKILSIWFGATKYFA